MKKSKLSPSKGHEGPVQNKKSAFGAHPMDAQAGAAFQGRTMAPVQAKANNDPVQLKEDVGPDAIPDAHVGYEYIAKMSYMDTETIRTKPEIIKFLTKFGYSAESAQVIKGAKGFAMLYIPGSAEGGNPPIIAFRGTEPTELYDLLADIDLSYIGEPQFTENKDLIESTLAGAGAPAVMLGHSLGGALAQKASLEFTSQCKEVVTFQAPALGLGEKLSAKDREEFPKSTHHIADHDLVDRAGLYRTPGEVFIHDSSLRPLKSHTTPMFGTSQFAEEREALGITTTKDEDGNEIDPILGHEIREQDPDKTHIEKHETYPNFRELSGVALEAIRSVAGVAKTAGEVVTGAGKLVTKGIGAIGKGIFGAFGGGKEDEEKKKPERRR